MPKYIWLATEGKSQLKPEKLEALKGRKVIAFPDVDAFQEWTVKLQTLNTQTGLNITVSDILQCQATDRDRQSHIDIADWLIRWRANNSHQDIPVSLSGLDPESIIARHPELQLLIEDLDLIPTGIWRPPT